MKERGVDPRYLTLIEELHLRSVMIVALQARQQIFGAIAFNLADRGYSYDEDDLALVEGLSHHIAVTIDRAHLYRDELKTREELQRRIHLQALISDLGQEALTSYDVSALMHKAATILTQTLGVEFSKILELQPDKKRLFLKAGTGWRSGQVGKTMLSAGLESHGGYTLLSREPVIVEDFRTETRFHAPPLLIEHKVISGVSVIIQGHAGPWGVLGIHSSAQRTFTPNDIHFVQSVANILGAALEQERWAREAEQTATLRERQRIARELHDAVSQTLFAANLLAESLPGLWERQPDQALMRLHQLHQLTRGAAAEMRILLVELRPESLIRANPGYLLTQLGYAMPGRQTIDISVRIQDSIEQPLPPEVQVTLYRIAQESLNNIFKHGQARQARLRFVRTESRVTLTITDNGQGFDVTRIRTGIGLKSMWERANNIQATFSVRSRVGRGTQVKLDWKIPDEIKAQDISDAPD